MEEPTAVNLVNGGESQQWKSKRARTDQEANLAPDAKGFVLYASPTSGLVPRPGAV